MKMCKSYLYYTFYLMKVNIFLQI